MEEHPDWQKILVPVYVFLVIKINYEFQPSLLAWEHCKTG